MTAYLRIKYFSCCRSYLSRMYGGIRQIENPVCWSMYFNRKDCLFFPSKQLCNNIAFRV